MRNEVQDLGIQEDLGNETMRNEVQDLGIQGLGIQESD
jgi:hypothetical protein